MTEANPSNTALATQTTKGCTNPECKASNRSTHNIFNCYWPGGGKEGQFPLNFGQRSKASTTAATATVTRTSPTSTQTGHFALTARALNTTGRSGILVDFTTNHTPQALIRPQVSSFRRGTRSLPADTGLESGPRFIKHKPTPHLIPVTPHTTSIQFPLVNHVAEPDLDNAINDDRHVNRASDRELNIPDIPDQPHKAQERLGGVTTSTYLDDSAYLDEAGFITPLTGGDTSQKSAQRANLNSPGDTTIVPILDQCTHVTSASVGEQLSAPLTEINLPSVIPTHQNHRIQLAVTDTTGIPSHTMIIQLSAPLAKLTDTIHTTTQLSTPLTTINKPGPTTLSTRGTRFTIDTTPTHETQAPTSTTPPGNTEPLADTAYTDSRTINNPQVHINRHQSHHSVASGSGCHQVNHRQPSTSVISVVGHHDPRHRHNQVIDNEPGTADITITAVIPVNLKSRQLESITVPEGPEQHETMFKGEGQDSTVNLSSFEPLHWQLPQAPQSEDSKPNENNDCLISPLTTILPTTHWQPLDRNIDPTGIKGHDNGPGVQRIKDVGETLAASAMPQILRENLKGDLEMDNNFIDKPYNPLHLVIRFNMTTSITTTRTILLPFAGLPHDVDDTLSNWDTLASATTLPLNAVQVTITDHNPSHPPTNLAPTINLTTPAASSTGINCNDSEELSGIHYHNPNIIPRNTSIADTPRLIFYYIFPSSPPSTFYFAEHLLPYSSLLSTSPNYCHWPGPDNLKLPISSTQSPLGQLFFDRV